MADDAPPAEPPEGMFRFVSNVGTATAIGAVYGSIISAWVAPKATKDGITLGAESIPSFRAMWKHVGGEASWFAGIAICYCLAEELTRSVRGQYDHYTSIGGGVGAGLFCGSRSRNPATAVLYGMGFGAAALTSHMTGGSTMQESKHYELLKTIRTV